MHITGFYVRNQKVYGAEEIIKKAEKLTVNASIAIIAGHNLTGIAEAGGISDAVRPLIATLQDLAEPVSYGFCIKGFMQIMAGNEHDGKRTIKGALGGLAGVYSIPFLTSQVKTVFKF